MKIPFATLRVWLGALFLVLGLGQSVSAAEWQWSVPDGTCRAYLWIPPNCQRVRAVVVSNHNMIEQGILEHPTMRKTLAELGIAEIWVVPYMELAFDFNKGAGEHFQRIVDAFAEQSGYRELRVAPVVPMGHSACATYPWNFAAWNPQRTLAILSIHGDAPQTDKTGYGRANIDWGDRQIDGIPGLMVMGEYEWGEERLAPAFSFLGKHPQTPMAFLCDAGHGHFDYSDPLVNFLAMFIRKAAAVRLPAEAGANLDQPIQLNPVDPAKGWRIDRWRKDLPPTAPAAPFDKYTGNSKEAFWCFDQEMAKATEAYHAVARGKKPQLLSITDLGENPQGGCGEPVKPRFLPENDNLDFKLKAAFIDAVPEDPKNGNPARWAGVPGGTQLGHASSGGPIRLSRIVGPLEQTGPDSFAVRFSRAEYTENGRNLDLWLWASHPGDKEYKSIVQQCQIRLKKNSEGAEQHITFPEIPDQRAGSLSLQATSDSGLPVFYYVLEGPVEISGNQLKFLPIPPRAKYPVKVTVVAWQWGRSKDPKVKGAERVERSFLITEPAEAAH